ncbi:KEOPS complex subunit Pcc1 [Methanofollis formosanus]|uniref:KEOPS complex subunit Pcc1 n=1 Tax=Methanofollis formosanus TaxID=299308 RepID=UPI001FEBD3B9|nr:KEOPS complex subunit Pcc1 [Methanofollis formosanus]
MTGITGRITTESAQSRCVAASLAPDNLSGMETRAEGPAVVTAVTGTHLRSVIASVDDYLMNLAIAEEVCADVRNDADHTGRPGDMAELAGEPEQEIQILK